jgi:gluconokinase
VIRQGGGSVASGESQGTRILSIDVGSSSVRAELYDGAGDNVEGTEVKLDYEFEYTADGGATQDADELFDLVVQAVDGALSAAGDAEISGVAMSTFWHSVLGLDGAGRPTTPILTWADRRAADSVPELLEQVDESAYHRRTGCVPHSSYWPAKLMWSHSAMPEAFGKAARWVSPADYFYARFFGEPYRVGTSMASGTGLLDQNRKRWDRQTLVVLPIEETQLSAISDEPRKGLAGEWADRWPALRDAPTSGAGARGATG